jgi:phospholipase C
MADPIKHVVVLMMENRSFDHLLGDCPKIKAKNGALNGKNTYDGEEYPQQPGAARKVIFDPGHDTVDVLKQLGGKDGVPPMGGFVRDYAEFHPEITPADLPEVMKYHAYGTLPAFHTLAENFLVCDRWHASVPGPTWVNRLFALSGTSLGRVKMPNGIMNLNLHWYDQSTVFDRLNESGKKWKVYFGDTPLSFLFVHQWSPGNALSHHHMQGFYQDAAGPEKDFPDFAFIEPAYLEPNANDAHPPHDIVDCDALVAKVYNAIRSNADLWASTLLIVLFDEHGGFYDHVEPPPAGSAVSVPPDHHQEEYSFDRLGVRVPAILVSPYVKNGICSTVFDHTSMLRYLKKLWGLGDLGARTAAAATFDQEIGAQPRTNTPEKISAKTALPPAPAVAVTALSDHQAALVAMSHNLESMSDEDAAQVAARSRHVLTGPQSQIDAAVDRVDAFLAAAEEKQARRTASGR